MASLARFLSAVASCAGVSGLAVVPSETAIAQDATALVDRVNLLLLYGQMSSGLRTQIITAVNAISLGTTAKPLTATQLATALKNRAKLAITLAMVSGEYLVQR